MYSVQLPKVDILYFAAAVGHIGIVKLLMISGAAINVEVNRMTPLLVAAKYGCLYMVENLIRLVLGVAVTCPDRARHISIILSQSTQVILTFITLASVICQKM